MEPTPPSSEPPVDESWSSGATGPPEPPEAVRRLAERLQAAPSPAETSWLTMDPATRVGPAGQDGQAPIPPKITVIEQVYYQPPADKPTSVIGSFAYDPKSADEPDIWKFTAQPHWAPLGQCRIDQPAFIMLLNRSATLLVQLGVIRPPTDESHKTMFDPPPRGDQEPTPLAPLLPGQTLRLPVDYQLTYVRGIGGTVPCTISVFPS